MFKIHKYINVKFEDTNILQKGSCKYLEKLEEEDLPFFTESLKEVLLKEFTEKEINNYKIDIHFIGKAYPLDYYYNDYNKPSTIILYDVVARTDNKFILYYLKGLFAKVY